MIELLMKLAEKIVELAQYRGSVNRQLFEDHIEPMYAEARKVVDDYRAILKDVSRMTADPAVPLIEIVKALEERRIDYERIRQELIAYSLRLPEERRRSDIKWFAEVCRELLLADPAAKGSRHTVLTSLLWTLKGMLPPSLEGGEPYRNYLVQEINKCEGRVNGAWQALTDAYTQLRLRCLR